MPIIIQYISGGQEGEHSLTKLHKVSCWTFYVCLIISCCVFLNAKWLLSIFLYYLDAFPNVVHSAVQNVSLPAGTVVVDTPSVPSIY